MEMKIPAIAITAVVVVIVLAGVLMPVLNDATDTDTTFKNAGYYDLFYTQTDDVTLEWDYTNPSVVTVNGDAISLPTPSRQYPKTIMCGDDWVLRLSASVDGNATLDFYTPTTSGGAGVTNTTSASVVASNGTATFTNTASVTRTASYTYLYCISADGDILMKDLASPSYVLGSSEIYGMGLTFGVLSENVYLKVSGSIDDGITAEIFGPSTSTLTVSDVDAIYSEVEGYKDLYSLEKVNITLTDGDSSAAVTYSYFIVPTEVSAEKSVHFTDNQNAIFAAIPIS